MRSSVLSLFVWLPRFFFPFVFVFSSNFSSTFSIFPLQLALSPQFLLYLRQQLPSFVVAWADVSKQEQIVLVAVDFRFIAELFIILSSWCYIARRRNPH